MLPNNYRWYTELYHKTYGPGKDRDSEYYDDADEDPDDGRD